MLDNNKINKALPLETTYLQSDVMRVLMQQENATLLNYVKNDAFGAHVFPGDIIDFSVTAFQSAMNQALEKNQPIHLWINLPFCERRCFFCQFPITILRDTDRLFSGSQKWLEANMQEALIWLKYLPLLKNAPIGEFNILGGTPTLLSREQLTTLIHFYKSNFNFTADSTIRIEGTASTYTKEKLMALKSLGVTKVSSGIQSFNNIVLQTANCTHTGEEALQYITLAKEIGFDAVNADFIYGLANQTVSQFLDDIKRAIALEVDCIVITKLHLKTFADQRTAVSGEKEALWQREAARQKIQDAGICFPSIAEQYQMREKAVRLLKAHHYTEHPTMYFYRKGKQPEKWKSLMVDQDKQFVEIGFGMGGSSGCMYAEAINSNTAGHYFEQIRQGLLPIASTRGFTQPGIIKKYLQMALSSCQPLQDNLFQARFPGQSLFSGKWASLFSALAKKELVLIDKINKTIALTPVGQTLVEAIIHTQLV